MRSHWLTTTRRRPLWREDRVRGHLFLCFLAAYVRWHRVIGRRKFSFDLWGDTVNTASRMESNGAAGRINVTGRVETALRDDFELEPRGPIEIKGKGTIEAFFLIGPRTP